MLSIKTYKIQPRKYLRRLFNLKVFFNFWSRLENLVKLKSFSDDLVKHSSRLKMLYVLKHHHEMFFKKKFNHQKKKQFSLKMFLTKIKEARLREKKKEEFQRI